MSEIEKMYENAGVEKSKCWDDCTTCTRTSCDKNISYIKAEYPPFTADKQLELIKFLIERGLECNICRTGKDVKYVFSVGYERSSGDFKEFTEALASMINDLWQDLWAEEKQQVKGILE